MFIEQDIKKGLLLALGWVHEHLSEFSIDITEKSQFSKDDLARIKPLSELGLTVWLLKRCGIQLGVLDKILQWQWQQSDQGKLLTRLLLARNDFLPACAFYAPLYQTGYYSKSLHEVLALLANYDMATVLPLQPWSRLALEYNLWKLDLKASNAILTDGLYVTSCPEPWVISSEIAYAITHEVFYLTDFGFRALPDSRTLNYLQTWTHYWAQIFHMESDFDVTGELAMVCSCIEAGDGKREEKPIHWLIKHQNEDGSVYGPEGAGSFLYLEGDSRERRDFLACYHTTLVFLMATALELRSINKKQLVAGSQLKII